MNTKKFEVLLSDILNDDDVRELYPELDEIMDTGNFERDNVLTGNHGLNIYFDDGEKIQLTISK